MLGQGGGYIYTGTPLAQGATDGLDVGLIIGDPGSAADGDVGAVEVQEEDVGVMVSALVEGRRTGAGGLGHASRPNSREGMGTGNRGGWGRALSPDPSSPVPRDGAAREAERCRPSSA